MQNFKIVAYLLPKYILVGGEKGVSVFLHSYSFGYLVPHAKLQNCSLSPSGLFLVS
jgi:hypothetical protein